MYRRNYKYVHVLAIKIVITLYRRYKIIKTKNRNNTVSTQNWLNIETIFENGIIKTKENRYIKIIRIKPINFNLKSELEKEAIINSYKIFLKTSNFDFQILIQSNKEDLNNHISKIKNNLISEKENINKISNKYIEYIKEINSNQKSSSKNYYLIIDYNNKNNDIIDLDSYAFEDLNNKFFKIKDGLSRCGNIAIDINNRIEIINILFSFLNKRIYLNNNLNN